MIVIEDRAVISSCQVVVSATIEPATFDTRDGHNPVRECQTC